VKRNSRAGITLVELLVVLVVLAVVLAVNAFAVVGASRSDAAERGARERRLRAESIRSGRTVSDSGRLFLPDGRAFGPGLDLITGSVRQ
jgi:prepilin-type N-terminal cleavage/methylation domain-containing protein